MWKGGGSTTQNGHVATHDYLAVRVINILRTCPQSTRRLGAVSLNSALGGFKDGLEAIDFIVDDVCFVIRPRSDVSPSISGGCTILALVAALVEQLGTYREDAWLQLVTNEAAIATRDMRCHLRLEGAPRRSRIVVVVARLTIFEEVPLASVRGGTVYVAGDVARGIERPPEAVNVPRRRGGDRGVDPLQPPGQCGPPDTTDLPSFLRTIADQ
mgnify:FL=1